jgi:hypothetical protein
VVRALCPSERGGRAGGDRSARAGSRHRDAARGGRCIAAKTTPAPGVLGTALGGQRPRRPRGRARGPDAPPAAGCNGAAPRGGHGAGTEEQLAAVAALRALRDPAAIPALEKAAAERLVPAVRDAVEAAIIDLRRAAEEPPPAAPADGTAPAPESGGADTGHHGGARGRAVKNSPEKN